MEIPEGFFEFSTEGHLYNPTDDIILELHKTIYGVVQAARAFNDEFNLHLEKKSLLQHNKADPCLYHCNDHHGTLIMIVYVDDCLLAGDESAIEDVLTHLNIPQGPFSITRDDSVTGFTRCSFTFNEAGIKVHQTKLVKTLEQYVPENGKEVKTPAPPGQILHKPNDDSTILTDDELTQYRRESSLFRQDLLPRHR